MNILKKCRRALAALLAVGTAFVATTAWAATPLPAPTWTMHSVKNTEIKLEWGAVDNALNYTLYYKESTAKNYLQRVVATTSTTYYGVKDKTYEFYLVANPKAGKDLEKSAASETKTILLNEEANPKEPLPTPTWTMHSVKNTEIKLEWSKVEDALNYTLYYKESTADKFQQLVVATNSTTYYGIKNRSYDFFVVANPKYNDGNAVSAASETKTILLNEEANPKDALPTPTWVMTSVKNTEIKLEWSKVEDALNYTLYYKESTADKFLQRVVATTSTTYYGIKDRGYDFFVVANPKYNDGYDVSAASETKTILLNEAANPKQTLATPTWTNVSASKTKIDLSWNEVDGALNYSLFYKEATAKNFSKLVIGKTSTTYYGIKGKTYEFYLVANPEYNNGYETSAASETRTITLDGNNVVNPPVDPNPNPDTPVDPNPNPDVPVDPNPNPDVPVDPNQGGSNQGSLAKPVVKAENKGTSILLTWNAVENAKATYKVFCKESSADKYGDGIEVSKKDDCDQVAYTITKCKFNKTYNVYVIAYPKTVDAVNGDKPVQSDVQDVKINDPLVWGAGETNITPVSANGYTIFLRWNDHAYVECVEFRMRYRRVADLGQDYKVGTSDAKWGYLTAELDSNNIFESAQDNTPGYTQREIPIPNFDQLGRYEVQVAAVPNANERETEWSSDWCVTPVELVDVGVKLNTPEVSYEVNGTNIELTIKYQGDYVTVWLNGVKQMSTELYNNKLVYRPKSAGEYTFTVTTSNYENSYTGNMQRYVESASATVTARTTINTPDGYETGWIRQGDDGYGVK